MLHSLLAEFRPSPAEIVFTKSPRYLKSLCNSFSHIQTLPHNYSVLLKDLDIVLAWVLNL
jgi:hypothetical protein